MVAKKWTEGDQEDFLYKYMTDFHEHKGKGTLTLFWPKLGQEWFERYPVETAKFARSKVDLTVGTPEEIRARKIGLQMQRFKDWYAYHSRVKPTATGRQETLDFMGKKPRLLQIHHAYSHRYYESKVAPVFEAEYKAYKDGLPKDAKPEAELTFKNRVLIRMYDNETAEVKAKCEAYRRHLVAIGKSAREAKAAYESGTLAFNDEGDDLLTGDRMRRTILERRQKNINILGGTCENFLRMIFESTKYRAVMLIGGREPDRDGKISSLVISSGETLDLGQDFQLFHPDWEGQVESVFTKWLQKCCDGEDDNLYDPSSQSTTPEESSTSDASTPTRAEATDNAPITTGIPMTNPPETPNGATSPPSNQNVVGRPAASTAPDFRFSTFGDGGNSPNDVLKDGNGLDVSAVSHSRTNGRAGAQNVSSTSATGSSTTDVAQCASNSSRERVTASAPTPGSNPTSTTDPSITNSNSNITDPPSATSTRANRAVAPIEGTMTVPPARPMSPSASSDGNHFTSPTSESSKALPTFAKEAYQFMMDNLNFVGALTAIEGWVTMELLLGPPPSNSTKISTSMRPDVVEWWYKHGRRNFEKVPELSRRKALGLQPGGAVGWYVDKQPGWRGTTWPLRKDDDLAKTEDWLELMKSGNCGFVMIMVCLTWWGMAIDTVEERRRMVEVLEDVNWVLKAMVARLRGKNAQTVAGPTKAKMKRKAGAAQLDVPAPSKRKSRSKKA